MFFIKSGRVFLKASNRVAFRSYANGAYFGEIELLENIPRLSYAQTSPSPSEFLSLSKPNLQLILEEFPNINEEFTKISAVRKKVNSEAMTHALELLSLNLGPDLDDSLHSSSSSSLSEPEEEFQNINNKGNHISTVLMRRDTGVLVSHLTYSPKKVKNIESWTKALKGKNRSKTELSSEAATLMMERQKSLRRQASLKNRKEVKHRLVQIKKAMKVGVNEEEGRRKEKNGQILGDCEDIVFSDVAKGEGEGEEGAKPSGLLNQVAWIDNKMLNHTEKTLSLAHRIACAQEDFIMDLNHLNDIINFNMRGTYEY